jgi:hypothetical protein
MFIKVIVQENEERVKTKSKDKEQRAGSKEQRKKR